MGNDRPTLPKIVWYDGGGQSATVPAGRIDLDEALDELDVLCLNEVLYDHELVTDWATTPLAFEAGWVEWSSVRYRDELALENLVRWVPVVVWCAGSAGRRLVSGAMELQAEPPASGLAWRLEVAGGRYRIHAPDAGGELVTVVDRDLAGEPAARLSDRHAHPTDGPGPHH